MKARMYPFLLYDVKRGYRDAIGNQISERNPVPDDTGVMKTHTSL